MSGVFPPLYPHATIPPETVTKQVKQELTTNNVPEMFVMNEEIPELGNVKPVAAQQRGWRKSPKQEFNLTDEKEIISTGNYTA